ncbi:MULTISPECIES: APC family permease [Rhizobium/Agrobacterium group]|uniref:APC family permease n=1 Tax=Rhizobium/Agrobacterium group TaxID=227290 RepID=UPI001ADCADA3|nr:MULTISPECIES: APC family permease [Rhizobium/Agrobacterium group]MBO9112457.1 APC family permease [Agrobacterium sp. S2/73]QXZ75966.1 APC family permease [Agrobacterium sp. S7/73]QYA17023.1 APC family permease [Rhizobium sp. AB2/73]UEQ85404.1 APC family permease [Rhizobium sp. AB2/73]
MQHEHAILDAHAPVGSGRYEKTLKLTGNLGPIGIAMMVVATAAPLTVMAGVSPLIIAFGNGASAPVDVILVGFVMLLFSVGFVEMSKSISNAGAFYSYILKGMGRVVGVGAASLAVVSYTLMLIALEAYIGFVASEAVITFTGVNLPWWLYTIGVVAIVGVLGYRNIEVSSKVLGIALLLEIGVILIANVVIFMSAGVAGLDTSGFNTTTFVSGSPGLGILFVVWGFVGFESTVVYREEAADPDRSIPIATYLAVTFITLLYFVSFWAIVTAIGGDKVVQVATYNAGTMYLDIVRSYLGDLAEEIAQVLLVTSLFAVVLSIHNIIARYKYVLGSCGVLFAQLSRVHEEHASPYVASAVQTFISLSILLGAAVYGADPVTQIYTWGAATGTLGYLVLVALTCLSVYLFFRSNPSTSGHLRTQVAPIVSLIGLVGFVLLALTNLGALTGSEGWDVVNIIILATLVVSFLVGALGAAFMMAKAPSRFNSIIGAA